MSLVDNTKIIKYLCLNNDAKCDYNITYDDIENIVLNFFEKSSGCTLFNKENLLLEIKNNFENNKEDLLKNIANIIHKNLIPQISFNSMFKSDLNFTLVFNQDDINIFYKNKKVELNLIMEIKKDLLENKLNYLPVITELFVENIGNIIEKLIKKDLTVKYYLINIPVSYWKLFEIKSKRISKKIIFDQNLEDIISGKNYQVKEKENSESDDELKAALIQIEEYEKNALNKNNLLDDQKQERDSLYRMEVMSYLNDDELNYFLEIVENINNLLNNMDFKTGKLITNLISNLLNIVAESSNTMIKYYVVFRMFSILLECEDSLLLNDTFRNVVYKKANDLLKTEKIFIQSSELELLKEMNTILHKNIDMINKINEKKYGKLVEDDSASESDDSNNFYPNN